MPSDKNFKDFIYLCKASRKSRQASLSWVITLKLVAFFVYIGMVYFGLTGKSNP